MAYNKHTWETNELITDILLNNMEDGIAAVTNTADNAVPKTLTINGKALSANIALDATDVGAVAKTGDTMTGNLRIASQNWPSYELSRNDGSLLGVLYADASDNKVALRTWNTAGTYYNDFKLPDTQAVTENATYDIVTTKGSYTLGGRLTAPGFTSKATNGYPNVYFQNSGVATGFVANEASTRRFMFNEYPSDSSTYYESFMIPAPSQGLTQNNFYSILTTKSLVTVAQGGTGANTATAALTNLGAVPTSRTITINGVTKALSDDVSFTIDSGGDISGDYLPLSGGTLSGDLKLNSTNAHLRVGSTDGSAGVSIYRSSEGGNINIKSPNGTNWEIDAYNNNLRIFTTQSGDASTVAAAWVFNTSGALTTSGVYSTESFSVSKRGIGYKLRDSAGEYFGLTDNGSNLWIGATATNGAHHIGGTYISTGYNSTTSAGQETIYVCVPNATNTGGTNYKVYREGIRINAADIPSLSYLPLTGGTISSTLTVSGLLTMNNDIVFNDVGTGTRQLKFVAGGNDYGRVAVGATATNAGWMEIATADDASEPIYVRQYSSNYTTVSRTLTLLDASGNTSIPGYLALGNALNLAYGGTGATTAAGARTNLGLGDMATQSTSNYWAVSASRTANTVLAAPNGSAGSASFRKLVAADIPALSYLSTGGGTLNGAVGFKSGISVTALNTTASGDFITVRDNNNTAFGYIKGATGGNVLRMSLGIYNTSSVFSEFSICLNSSNVPYCTIAGYEMWSKRTMYYSSSVPAASSGSNGDICFVPA